MCHFNRYYPGPGSGIIFNSTYKLPSDLTCDQCVLQWRYIAGNNWGSSFFFCSFYSSIGLVITIHSTNDWKHNFGWILFSQLLWGTFFSLIVALVWSVEVSCGHLSFSMKSCWITKKWPQKRICSSRQGYFQFTSVWAWHCVQIWC